MIIVMIIMNNNHMKVLVFLIMFTGLSVGSETISDNVHTVTDGMVYRSAQPSSNELEKLIKDLKLKSILNLRGLQAGSQWYREEIRTAQKYKVAHYDISLSAEKYVPPDQLSRLIALIHLAPKPILIHCQGEPTGTAW